VNEGWLYDGQSAIKRSVRLRPALSGLNIEVDGRIDTITADKLLHVESRSDAEVYGRSDLSGWRLGLAKPVAPEIGALLPRKQNYGRWIDRVGLPKALVIGAAASAIILLLGHKSPAWIAPLVPPAWEKELGNSLVGDFGGNFCSGAGGQEALDKLAARLSPGSRDLNIRVVDIKMVNAAALPGGNIVIFRELLSEADGPDEVAGVLGHEIAHIENHDVTEGMIRHMGFGMIIALFGGSTGSNIDALMSANYSRAAETEADEDAIASLQRANISPLPTAAFFGRLAAQEKRLGRIDAGLEYLSTHPLSEGRERRFRAGAVPGKAYQPALTPDEWNALFSICHNDPDRDRN
jgi:hypothetical protein